MSSPITKPDVLLDGNIDENEDFPACGVAGTMTCSQEQKQPVDARTFCFFTN